jgi:uncharacterized protein YuzE
VLASTLADGRSDARSVPLRVAAIRAVRWLDSSDEGHRLLRGDPGLIEFRDVPVVETRDLDENMLLDLDADGSVRSITIEHASKRADAPRFSYEQVAA